MRDEFGHRLSSEVRWGSPSGRERRELKGAAHDERDDRALDIGRRLVAGPEDRVGQPLGVGGERLFEWFSDGDTPSRHYPAFKMSAASAELFDAFGGVWLLESGLPAGTKLAIAGVVDAPGVTHLTYKVLC
jgi:hypothetical protein